MLQYLRWLWREAPRSLRVEFLITILVIELLALATILVLENPQFPAKGNTTEDVSTTFRP